MDKLFSNKRILIYGAGAIGSYYGGFMAKAGFDITFVARGAHLEKMQKRGSLIINSRDTGVEEIPVKALAKPDGVYDIIFICVKSHDTLEACKVLVNHIHDDTILLSYQNGVENTGIMEQFFNKDNIMGCSLFVGLQIQPAGTVFHTSHGEIVCGAITKEGQKHAPVIEHIYKTSGLKYQTSDNIKYIQWKKLIWNIAYNPLSALLSSTCGKMRLDESIAELMDKMVYETLEAAKLDGVEIEKEVWRDLVAHRDSLDDYKTSMLQDIEKGRNPEIDGILGPVIRKLESDGRSAPYCETVFRSLQFKYGKHFVYPPRLSVDVIVRKGNSMLMVERKYPPHGWAIPGGFVDYGEKVEDAAHRELKEETNLDNVELKMLGVYSDPKRDPRGHTVSVVFYTNSDMPPTAGDDAADAKFIDLKDLPDQIPFDHRQIIEDYLKVKPLI